MSGLLIQSSLQLWPTCVTNPTNHFSGKGQTSPHSVVSSFLSYSYRCSCSVLSPIAVSNFSSKEEFPLRYVSGGLKKTVPPSLSLSPSFACNALFSSGWRRTAILSGQNGNVSRLEREEEDERERERVEEEERNPFGVYMEGVNFGWKTEEGETAVLKNCSLKVPRGKFWMLLGPNGCGKSTLLKILAGLTEPSGGTLRVIGPRSFVFQNPDHQVVMPTVCSDVAFGLGHLHLSDDDVTSRVTKALTAVGMRDYLQRSVATLSGGEKQRVAIAGALAEGSRVLLLDELTTFLDQADQIAVLEAMREVVGGERGVTALWVTHRLEELAYADGAAYMEGGRVMVAGEVDEFRARMSVRERGWPASRRPIKG